MTSTSLIFAFRSTGNTWQGALMNCDDPLNPVRHNLTGYDEVYVVFTKPDGTQWPTDEQIESGFSQGAVLVDPDDPQATPDPENNDIKYENLALPPFTDQKGSWEYTVAAKLGNNIIKSPFSAIFWV